MILSRHRGEKIIVSAPGNEEFVITILEVCGDKVRLGFTAPTEIMINREEIHRKIQREKGIL